MLLLFARVAAKPCVMPVALHADDAVGGEARLGCRGGELADIRLVKADRVSWAMVRPDSWQD